jgi:hypothetical protein
MTRILLFLILCVLVVSSASAEEYWIAYEADDFPENEGWWHIWGGGTAERRIEDGMFVLDTLHDPHIADFYQMNMYGSLDPAPGEVFVMQWRLRIDEIHGPDIGLAIFSDDRWAVGLSFEEGTVTSSFESGVSAVFEPWVFHEFEFRSDDMQAYQLYIDGDLAMEGSFWLSLTDSKVNWGDGVQGASSLSRWDYVRFGVIPEPSCGFLLTAAFLTRRDRI